MNAEVISKDDSDFVELFGIPSISPADVHSLIHKMLHEYLEKIQDFQNHSVNCPPEMMHKMVLLLEVYGRLTGDTESTFHDSLDTLIDSVWAGK